MEQENKKGISLPVLVALIVSSAIGGGTFNVANQLAAGATPGGAIISWIIVGIGILALVLCLNHLVMNKPELSGVSDYAKAGFGDFVGFISGWGYWLSAWLGNIAFAVLMMQSVGYFFSGWQKDDGSLTILSVIVASVVSWLLTILVIQGVESAAVINAIILVCKLIPLAVFIVVGIVVFKAGVFTAHFWGNVVTNAQGAVSAVGHISGADLVGQIKSSLMVMVWLFVGIEGAAMMGDRAKRKSEAGKATVLGFLSLFVLYLLLSLLPYGFMSQGELAAVKVPGLVYILKAMVGGWGGTIMAVGLIISLLGSWLSWTMLPVEATQQLSDQKLLPGWFGKLNKNKAAVNSLWLTQIFQQIFLILTYFVASAYSVMQTLCTAAVMVCYALVGAYMLKIGIIEKSTKNGIIGFIACAFQVIALYLSGWKFLWLVTILYTIGLVLYYYGKKQHEARIGSGEKMGIGIVAILGIVAFIGLFTNWFDLATTLFG